MPLVVAFERSERCRRSESKTKWSICDTSARRGRSSASVRSTVFAVDLTDTAIVALFVSRPASRRAVTGSASVYDAASLRPIVIRSIHASVVVGLVVSLSTM